MLEDASVGITKLMHKMRDRLEDLEATDFEMFMGMLSYAAFIGKTKGLCIKEFLKCASDTWGSVDLVEGGDDERG